MDEIKELAKPLQEYLQEHYNLHCFVVVENGRIRICESILQTFPKENTPN